MRSSQNQSYAARDSEPDALRPDGEASGVIVAAQGHEQGGPPYAGTKMVPAVRPGYQWVAARVWMRKPVGV
jgi:hypothetical protein